ncbi:MAG: two-component system, NtrC family, nitrogen regulation response regulator NtrX [Acidobacteriota bacterium]|nr:two-component system, NtrC family, nitrogen regulation response regulator NtrX [Acidobacteriota bacterium]
MIKGKDLLIIDDEEFFFQPILERLDSEKLSYDYCKTGLDGLERLAKTDYHAVILDIRLPLGDKLDHVSGYEEKGGLYILEEIRKKKPGLPVICYTVYKDREVVEKINQAGAIHIEKGGDLGMLIETIKSKIGHLKGGDR